MLYPLGVVTTRLISCGSLNLKKPHSRGIMWLDVLLLQASWGVYSASGLVRLTYEDLQPGVSERPMTVQTQGRVEKNMSSIHPQKPPWKQDLKGKTQSETGTESGLELTASEREGRCSQAPVRLACDQMLAVNSEPCSFRVTLSTQSPNNGKVFYLWI